MRKKKSGFIFSIIICGIFVYLLHQLLEVAFLFFIFAIFIYFTIKLVDRFFQSYNSSSHKIESEKSISSKKQNSNRNLTNDELNEYAEMCNISCELNNPVPTDIPNLEGNFRFNDKRFSKIYAEPSNNQISPKTLHLIQNVIISTYNSFGVSVKVDNFTFSKYYVIAEAIPCPGTSVKSVLAFQNEISIALGTEVIINAMYKKGYIGIIIPIIHINQISNVAEHAHHDDTINTNIDAQRNFNIDRDPYFVDAGRFIIEKEKASIGMLQRVFQIGFNRAARIMDQLAESGVVGEEDGTKPRKVLMSMEEFEKYIEK